ncbi:hypothetical protein [[Ruminococcus] torques]|uniref:hypothetical protein n=1 Tax=[Ruminococcus] torques TaxID=33039 RepID=UPI00242CF389|nr:hypothetical protein [[Ruminococcus] torques]
MTDRGKFKSTFEKLHASPDVLEEVMEMTKKEGNAPVKKKCFSYKIAAVIAMAVIVLGTGSMAYAKNWGGIQRIVQIWIHGEQTDAVFKVDSGKYTLEYEDADGQTISQSGGGVAFNADGTERALTEEELWSEANAPEVVYEEGGSVWVYYLDQKIDITDKFEDDVCYIELKVDDEIRYMTVKYQNGYAMSPYSYVQPDEFNGS